MRNVAKKFLEVLTEDFSKEDHFMRFQRQKQYVGINLESFKTLVLRVFSSTEKQVTQVDNKIDQLLKN